MDSFGCPKCKKYNTALVKNTKEPEFFILCKDCITFFDISSENVERLEDEEIPFMPIEEGMRVQ